MQGVGLGVQGGQGVQGQGVQLQGGQLHHIVEENSTPDKPLISTTTMKNAGNPGRGGNIIMQQPTRALSTHLDHYQMQSHYRGAHLPHTSTYYTHYYLSFIPPPPPDVGHTPNIVNAPSITTGLGTGGTVTGTLCPRRSIQPIPAFSTGIGIGTTIPRVEVGGNRREEWGIGNISKNEGAIRENTPIAT